MSKVKKYLSDENTYIRRHHNVYHSSDYLTPVYLENSRKFDNAWINVWNKTFTPAMVTKFVW